MLYGDLTPLVAHTCKRTCGQMPQNGLCPALPGGIAVTLVGHPFDTTKVRLQTQSSTNPIYCEWLHQHPLFVPLPALWAKHAALPCSWAARCCAQDPQMGRPSRTLQGVQCPVSSQCRMHAEVVRHAPLQHANKRNWDACRASHRHWRGRCFSGRRCLEPLVRQSGGCPPTRMAQQGRSQPRTSTRYVASLCLLPSKCLAYMQAVTASQFGSTRKVALGARALIMLQADGMPLSGYMQAGAITGFVSAFVEGPIDFFKSQIQVQIIRAKSNPDYKRTRHSLYIFPTGVNVSQLACTALHA